LSVVDAARPSVLLLASPTPPTRLQTCQRHERSQCGFRCFGPHSSRWLGPRLVAEVLARASFGESEIDVPRAGHVAAPSREPTHRALAAGWAFPASLKPLTPRCRPAGTAESFPNRSPACKRHRLAAPKHGRACVPLLDLLGQERAGTVRVRDWCCTRSETPSVVPRIRNRSCEPTCSARS